MTSKIIRVASLILASLSIFVTPASAGTINVDFLETGTGVTLSGSGTFDTAGLTLSAFQDFSNQTLLFVSPINGSFGAGAVSLADAFLTSPSTPFGTGNATTATFGNGDVFGLAFCEQNTPCVLLPDNYTSGSQLAFSANFDGESFQSLGITATNPVSITAGNNTINVGFGMPVVPLPPALPLLGGALLGLGALGRNARRRTART